MTGLLGIVALNLAILLVIDEEIAGWRDEVGPHDGRDMIDALAMLRARFEEATDEA